MRVAYPDETWANDAYRDLRRSALLNCKGLREGLGCSVGVCDFHIIDAGARSRRVEHRGKGATGECERNGTRRNLRGPDKRDGGT